MNDLIARLCETYGPPGDEGRVAALVRAELQGHVDELRVDPLGNLIARIGPRGGGRRGKGGGGRRIMVSAHMDEIGIICSYIDEQGFIRFQPAGGLNPHVLLGQRVVFASGAVGVFGNEKLDEIKDLRFDRMFVDVGAASRAEAQQRVRVGDAACFHRPFEALGQRLTAKAMDDRIGCAVAILAARALTKTPHEVVFVFTVQEEVGLRGARTAAFSVEPDIGIALDVTVAGDTPKPAHVIDVRLGGGAAIKARDDSLIAHPKVKDWLLETARSRGIPHQVEVLGFGGTDAGAIHTSRAGAPSGCISIPTRYLHTPAEVVDAGDVRACVDLLVAALSGDAPL